MLKRYEDTGEFLTSSKTIHAHVLTKTYLEKWAVCHTSRAQAQHLKGHAGQRGGLHIHYRNVLGVICAAQQDRLWFDHRRERIQRLAKRLDRARTYRSSMMSDPQQ